MQMRCIRVSEIGRFDWTQAEVQPPKADEVCMRVEVTGLCRTDLKLIRVGHRDLMLPRIPGEEVVGVVQGTGAEVHDFQVGRRVYVYPGVWCGKCPACEAGAENLCQDMQIMGFHRDGGFAEYLTVPAQSLIAVPGSLEPELAVFAEPLSCCINALELGGIAAGKSVGIWGAGPAGTLLARAAQSFGALALNIEPDERRRKRIGGHAVCPDRTFDLCIAAVGDRQAYADALTRLNPRGRLVVFSGLTPDQATLPVDFNQLHYLEQTIVGAYGCCYRHGKTALDLIADGKVAVADMISHRMPLEQLAEALRLVQDRRGMKILLYP